jgi:transcriptional regulator with XRE-family HTH domain
MRDWLRNARIQNGLSQKELGGLLGISQNAVSDHERGVRTPGPKTAIGYINVLSLEEHEKSFEDFYKD